MTLPLVAADVAAAAGMAVTDSETRQSLEDAWWTGPVLAASPASAPQGHFQVEPYFYDSIRVGHFAQDGTRRSASRAHSVRFGTFLLYGLSDRVSVGVIPVVGFNRIGSGSRSRLGLGDLSLQAQYRITDFQQGGPIPTTSILLTVSIPTGRYERLGSRPDDGLGSGAYTATASVYSQYFFWLPTGRLLRTRLDLSFSISDYVSLHDVSVYGTPQGFRGRAAPGDSFVACMSGEYSVTRKWVLALELAYQHGNNTRVSGRSLMALGHAGNPREFTANSGSSRSTGLAPELEYNWSSRAGLLAGVIFTVSGRNVGDTITPALAINYNL